MVFFPKVTRVIPAPLVSIVVLTTITLAAGLAVPSVGDKGDLPSSLPVPGLPPDVPFTLDTLTTIAPLRPGDGAGRPHGVPHDRPAGRRHHGHPLQQDPRVRRPGVANIVTGFFGGMGGCAMIGQTMINVRVSGGARTRLSTFLAGSFLMVLCIVFGPVVSDIPMAALVAVMVMVSFATFDWHSIAPKTLRRMPLGETAVMVITVAIVVATSNLAIGVVVGSVTAMVIFARRVAHLADVTAVVDPDGGQVVYSVTGELFFASSNDLVTRFAYATDPPDKVVIDLSATHIWDASSVAALDAIGTKYAPARQDRRDRGLNRPSAAPAQHAERRADGRALNYPARAASSLATCVKASTRLGRATAAEIRKTACGFHHSTITEPPRTADADEVVDHRVDALDPAEIRGRNPAHVQGRHRHVVRGVGERADGDPPTPPARRCSAPPPHDHLATHSPQHRHRHEPPQERLLRQRGGQHRGDHRDRAVQRVDVPRAEACSAKVRATTKISP